MAPRELVRERPALLRVYGWEVEALRRLVELLDCFGGRIGRKLCTVSIEAWMGALKLWQGQHGFERLEESI